MTMNAPCEERGRIAIRPYGVVVGGTLREPQGGFGWFSCERSVRCAPMLILPRKEKYGCGRAAASPYGVAGIGALLEGGHDLVAQQAHRAFDVAFGDSLAGVELGNY